MAQLQSTSITGSLAVSGSSPTVSIIGLAGAFIPITIQNLSGSSTGSSDFIAIQDTGNIYSGVTGFGFIDFGINNSHYTSGFVGSANDAYLFMTSSGNLYIGNISPTKNLYFFAGGYVNTSSLTLSSSGLFTIPNGSITGSILGSSSYSTSSYNGALAWGNFTIVGTTLTSNITRNLTISRIGTGLYGFKFSTSASNIFYIPSFNGMTGSNAAPTASIGTMINQNTSSFSMSVVTLSSSIITRADCQSGSISIFGF
jgi:hypothetical protein